MPAATSIPFFRRRAALIAGCALVLLLAAAALAWFTVRLAIAQWLLDDALRGLPLAGAKARVIELGTGHAVFDTVDLPGAGSVAQVAVRFTMEGLLDGRVESVTLVAPRLAIGLGSDGTPGGVAGEFLAGDGGTPASGLPFDELVIEDGRVDLQTPAGAMQLAVAGRYDAAGDDEGYFHWQATTPWGDVAGEAAVTGLAAGTPRTTLDFAAPRLAYMTAVVDALTGRATLGLGVAPTALLSLQAAACEIDGHPLGPLAASGTWTVEGGSLDLDVGNAESAATARLTAGIGAGMDATWALSGLVAVAEDLVLPLPQPLAVRAPARLEFALDLDMADAAAGLVDHASGKLSLAAAGLAIPRLASAGAVSLAASVGGTADGLALALTRPLSVEGLVSRADAPAWLAPFAGRAFDLSVPAEGLDLRVATDSGGSIHVDADVDLALAEPDGFALEATGRFAVGLALDGSPADVAVTALQLTLDGPFLPGIAFADLAISGNGAVDADSLRADIDIEGGLHELAMGGLDARDVDLTLPLRLERSADGPLDGHFDPVAVIGAGRVASGEAVLEDVLAELPLVFRFEGDGASLKLAADGWIDIAAASHPLVRSRTNLSVRLQADELAVLDVANLDGEPAWDTRFLVAGSAVEFDLLDGSGNAVATVTGTLPDLRLSMASLGGDHLDGTAETSGGDLRIAGPDLVLSNIDALVSYNNAFSPWPELQMTTLRLGDMNEPGRIAPFLLDVRLRPVWPEGDDLRLTLDVHLPGHRYLANLEASWEPGRDRLSGYLRVPPLKFGPELQPEALSPLYGPLFADATGSVELVGALGIEHGAAFSDLDVILDGLSGELAGATLEKLAGTIHLSGLDPLATPPAQRLTALRIDPGLPMEDLQLDFALPGDGTLAIDAAALSFAGGEVTAGPVTFDPAQQENRIVLHVAGVDLARLAALLEMPEVQATGTLAGDIPLLLAAGDIGVESGRLATSAPGVLRYLPEDAESLASGDENLQMVVTALADFHYEELSLDIERELGGASVVGLHVSGANPELYDGYPIELNVNLTGDLDRIVRDSLAGWRIPEEIRERLSGF